MIKTITNEEYINLSNSYGLEIEVIKAVESVEANGNGYILNNLPKILFEAHIFHRLTHGKYDKKYLKLSSLVWNRSLYKGGINEYVRLSEAFDLNQEAALKSCSWGLYQIMGFNYASCGYETVYEFIEDVKKGLVYCLKQFLSYCNKNKLIGYLKNKNWVEFSRRYNGLSYAINKYHIKLKKAYEDLKKQTQLNIKY